MGRRHIITVAVVVAATIEAVVAVITVPATAAATITVAAAVPGVRAHLPAASTGIGKMNMILMRSTRKMLKMQSMTVMTATVKSLMT